MVLRGAVGGCRIGSGWSGGMVFNNISRSIMVPLRRNEVIFLFQVRIIFLKVQKAGARKDDK